MQFTPADADTLNNLGVAFQSHGNLEQAIGCFRQAIALEPSRPESYNNLGLAFASQGKLTEAVSCYETSLMRKPDYFDALFNGGMALHAQGNLQAAIGWYRRALQLQPDSISAVGNLGNALHDLGRIDEATACYRRGIELKPDDPRAYNNLGTVHKDRGEFDEAIANFAKAIEHDPAFAEAYFNLGLAYDAQQKFEQAIECYQKAADLRPNFFQAHYERGNSFHALKRFDEAIDAYRRALDLNPNYAEALNNLGRAYLELDDLPQAAAAFRRAIEIRPNLAEVHNNLGFVLKESGQICEAAASNRRAIELAPEYPEPRWNEAQLLLLQGDFEHGWPAYEWRWKTGKLTARKFPQPQWLGEPLAGKTILLHAEQGLGDTIQFIRYAPLIKRLGATVVVECLRPLTRLLASCPGIDQLLPAGAALPPFDFHTPLLSIPAALKTTLSTVPHEVPYLSADPALVAHWRDVLRKFPGFRIGINWRGRTDRIDSRRRDIPPELIASFAGIPGVQLISLQKGAGQEDLSNPAGHLPIIDLGEFDTAHGPFMDTAAIMQNLDLIISSDTSVPHLAGALGRPVWVALPFSPSWHWLLDRSDSPWYPTMRLFRQKSLGDWEGVVSEIRTAVRQAVATGISINPERM
jgi:tetratricopeptide (TPR) repeat protein